MKTKIIKWLAAYISLGYAYTPISASEARVAAGARVTITVTLGEGTPPFTYQWKKNGGDIPGATSETLVLPSIMPADAARYSVLVTNKAGYTRSDDASITISVMTAITAQPVSQSIVVGKPVTFSVTAIGTSPLTYQWRKNGVNITGAVGSTYSIPAVLSIDAANYSVVVTNSEGNSITSLEASLTVTIAAPLRAVTGIVTG